MKERQTEVCRTNSDSDRIRALKCAILFSEVPMRKTNFVFAAMLLIVVTSIHFAQTGNAPRYQLPPKEVVDAFDAPPLPAAILSPTKQVLALTYRRPYPTIAEMSQPILRLAGARVNPNTFGPQRTGNIY